MTADGGPGRAVIGDFFPTGWKKGAGRISAPPRITINLTGRRLLGEFAELRANEGY
jgi:hypothetical protein